MVCRSAILENSHSVRLPLFRRHLVFRKIVCCPAEPKMPPGGVLAGWWPKGSARSEEHTSELQSLMRISYAVFCLKKKIASSTTAPPPSKCNNTTTLSQNTTNIQHVVLLPFTNCARK